MKIWRKRLFALALVGMLGTMVACGEDEEPEANANQNDDNDNDEPIGEVPSLCDDDDDGEGDEVVTGESDFASEYELRFNEFAFDDDSPGFDLNGTIEMFLDQSEDYPIIVLLELSDLDTEAGEVQVKGGAGLHADLDDDERSEYVWDDSFDEPDATTGTIDVDGNFTATLPQFRFVATVVTEDPDEENLKTIIPIIDLDLEAQLEYEEDSPVVNDGVVDGFILEEDADDVEIALTPGGSRTPLATFLGTKNFDYSCDGDADAWQLSATFSAEETVIVE